MQIDLSENVRFWQRAAIIFFVLFLGALVYVPAPTVEEVEVDKSAAQLKTCQQAFKRLNDLDQTVFDEVATWAFALEDFLTTFEEADIVKAESSVGNLERHMENRDKFVEEQTCVQL